MFTGSKFVEFLRTYSQHEKLPTITSSLSFDTQSNDGFIFTVTLDSAELLRSSSINSKPKKFIREQGDTIDIKAVLASYHHQICDFYNWVKIRQNDIHSEDMSLLNALYVEERSKALKRFISTVPQAGHRGSIKEQLYEVLTDDDYKQLDQYSNNESQWLEQALLLIESEVNQKIPDEVKAYLKSLCSL